jgi:hypothetical protein
MLRHRYHLGVPGLPALIILTPLLPIPALVLIPPLPIPALLTLLRSSSRLLNRLLTLPSSTSYLWKRLSGKPMTKVWVQAPQAAQTCQ